jgi:hypothetical protein
MTEYVFKEYKSGRIKIQMYKKGKPFGKPMFALNIRSAVATMELLVGTERKAS